jgi:heterodisulfide reductase subunit C
MGMKHRRVGRSLRKSIQGITRKEKNVGIRLRMKKVDEMIQHMRCQIAGSRETEVVEIIQSIRAHQLREGKASRDMVDMISETNKL